jgi:hypothetical protein
MNMVTKLFGTFFFVFCFWRFWFVERGDTTKYDKVPSIVTLMQEVTNLKTWLIVIVSTLSIYDPNGVLILFYLHYTFFGQVFSKAISEPYIKH